MCKAPFSEQGTFISIIDSLIQAYYSHVLINGADLRAAGHIEAIAHICKNMTSTVNAVVNQGPQVAISGTIRAPFPYVEFYQFTTLNK